MIYFLMYPMIAVTLNRIYIMEKNKELEAAEAATNLLDIENDDGTSTGKQVTFLSLFLIPRFLMGVISQIMVFTTVTFL